jgi:Spy/CpxP family protein refolding chaperone
MKKGYLACLAIFFLFFATPLFAQGIDIDDEELTLMAADTGPADPPAALAPGQGQPPAAGPEKHWDKHRPGEMHHGDMAGRWHFLNLSKDQRTNMRELWRRHFAETHNLRYDLMEKRLEMARLFTDPKAGSAALSAKQKELSAIRQQLMERRAQAVIEWRSLLTPEQIEKLDLMVMAHFQMGRPMGHGMDRGCGMHREMGPGMMGHEMGRGMMGHDMGPGGPSYTAGPAK